MKTSRYVRTKVELAHAIGMSRPRLYMLLRLPGAPGPKADGRWPVEDVRSFALRSAKVVSAPVERDRLQVALMKLKIKRAAEELSEFRRDLDIKIRDEYLKCFEGIFGAARLELHRAINELAQHFNDHEVSKLGRKLVDAALAQSVQNVAAKTGVMPRIDKLDDVIPFRKVAV